MSLRFYIYNQLYLPVCELTIDASQAQSWLYLPRTSLRHISEPMRNFRALEGGFCVIVPQTTMKWYGVLHTLHMHRLLEN